MRIVGVEAGGDGAALHAASLGSGRVSILHGSRSYVLADEHGQVNETHSISAGLDYPGVGPEHVAPEGHRPRRVRAARPTRTRSRRSTASAAWRASSRRSSRRTRWRRPSGSRASSGRTALVLVGLSGRGDKDVDTIMEREAGQ